MRVQLLTFPGCPHAGPTRERLERILAELGVAGPIQEFDTSSPDTPASLRAWPSPTILLDGADVEGGSPSGADGTSCRLYPEGGMPSETAIREALLRKMRGP